MRDKNTLPIDMICELLTHNTLYGSLRSKFGKRFAVSDWGNQETKIQEYKNEIKQNPDPHVLRIMKSQRLCYKYAEHIRSRMNPEIEKVFFEKQKNTYAYYYYCNKFNIIVEEFNQIVTEVALECKDSYLKKDYLETVLKKRRTCGEFIEQHIKLLEISPTDTIEKLLASLKK